MSISKSLPQLSESSARSFQADAGQGAVIAEFDRVGSGLPPIIPLCGDAVEKIESPNVVPMGSLSHVTRD